MLSVIFATFNGSDSLPLMLESLTKILPPEGGWKLVAVDNASTDNSILILESYLDKLPLTILTEKNQGKNAALNTGIQHIEGDLVVFTDDDVVVDPLWLKELALEATLKQDFDVFAGLILPFWKIKPEPWVLDWVNHQTVYGFTSSSLATGEIKFGSVFGANMAIRASFFSDGNRFDTAIGPDGTLNYKMGSETSLVKKLAQDGARCYFTTTAKVQHIISENEMDYNWVLGRAVRSGRGQFSGFSFIPPLWLGVPRYLYKDYFKNLILLFFARLRFNKKEVFMCHWACNITRGKMLEAKEFYRNETTKPC